MIAIDTNLLVLAHRMQVPEHRAARKAIEKASMDSDGWGFALTSLLEFWSIVTHPAAPPRPSTPDEVSAHCQIVSEKIENEDGGEGEKNHRMRFIRLGRDVARFIQR